MNYSNSALFAWTSTMSDLCWSGVHVDASSSIKQVLIITSVWPLLLYFHQLKSPDAELNLSLHLTSNILFVKFDQVTASTWSSQIFTFIFIWDPKASSPDQSKITTFNRNNGNCIIFIKQEFSLNRTLYQPGLCRRKAQADEGKPDTWSPPGTGQSEPEWRKMKCTAETSEATTHVTTTSSCCKSFSPLFIV